MSDKFSYPKWFKTRRYFIATAFELCVRICCSLFPGESGGTEIETHQRLVYADDLNLLGYSFLSTVDIDLFIIIVAVVVFYCL
jgi:hypothetical protein